MPHSVTALLKLVKILSMDLSFRVGPTGASFRSGKSSSASCTGHWLKSPATSSSVQEPRPLCGPALVCPSRQYSSEAGSRLLSAASLNVSEQTGLGRSRATRVHLAVSWTTATPPWATPRLFGFLFRQTIPRPAPAAKSFMSLVRDSPSASQVSVITPRVTSSSSKQSTKESILGQRESKH